MHLSMQSHLKLLFILNYSFELENTIEIKLRKIKRNCTQKNITIV